MEVAAIRADLMNTMPFQKNTYKSISYIDKYTNKSINLKSSFGMTQLAFSTFFSETKMPELAKLTQAYYSWRENYLRRPNLAINAT